MKRAFITLILSGTLSAAFAGGVPVSLLSKANKVALQRQMKDGGAVLRVLNADGEGFVVKAGNEVIGYSERGTFDEQTAAPAMLEWIESMAQADATTQDAGYGYTAEAVQPLLGEIAWNQNSPYNDLCPQYEIGHTAPTGCVATAMAQVMYYHKWPVQGEGYHEYSPAVLVGNTISADFGNTFYQWGAMLPSYNAASSTESRAAVAELMLHCGISVDMFYYTQSGALDIDVPPALTTYFRYDHSMAYRKREHYSTHDWLQLINEELKAGRPVLAYGRASSGGHAYVFDGMDENGYIHVNWGWGGMSNGYFRTSDLTPASQGIGGSDGGFNYSQRIITGIRPGIEGENTDYAVELTSTEGLTPSKWKVNQGQDFTMKLAGKVTNHGWRDSDFDYALLLVDADGNTVKTIEGPKAQHLDINATDYAPTFGTINLGTLSEGEYHLYPACRMSEGTGEWQRIRDSYIGYPNYLTLTATATTVSMVAPNYFNLKATDTEVPEAIYNGVPALVTAKVENQGDVEYHGEVKVQLRNSLNSIVATTTNYIIDLMPGEETQMRFTDAYYAEPGSYTLVLVDDDGKVISAKIPVSVQTAPQMGTAVSTTPLSIDNMDHEDFTVTAKLRADGGIVAGSLYTYIYANSGNALMGCLYPEYVYMDKDGEAVVTMRGAFENAQEGVTYRARLAILGSNGYVTFLEDEASECYFTYGDPAGIGTLTTKADGGVVYNLSGMRAGGNSRGIKIIKGKKIVAP